MANLISDRRKFELEQMGRMVVKPGEAPVRFTSTAHYRRYLKSKGLTDDISRKDLKSMSWNDSRRERVTRESVKHFVQSTHLEAAMHQRDAIWLQRHGRAR